MSFAAASARKQAKRYISDATQTLAEEARDADSLDRRPTPDEVIDFATDLARMDEVPVWRLSDGALRAIATAAIEKFYRHPDLEVTRWIR